MRSVDNFRWLNGLFTGVLEWYPSEARTIRLPNVSGFIPVLSVHAVQTAALNLTSTVFTRVLFNTVPFNSESLFAGGYFTPNSNGSWKISFNLYGTATSGSVGSYAVNLFQGETSIVTLFGGFESGGFVCNSGFCTVNLLAGTAYHIRVLISGTGPKIEATNSGNSVLFERIS